MRFFKIRKIPIIAAFVLFAASIVFFPRCELNKKHSNNNSTLVALYLMSSSSSSSSTGGTSSSGGVSASTTASSVYGQGGSFTSNTANNGGVSANSLNYPQGIAIDSTGVYIADSINNRVLYFSDSSTTATRVYGQNNYTANSDNYVGSVSADTLNQPTGVAVDSSGVYIADTGNNRVLYYSSTSTPATRVYGQGGSFTTKLVNGGGSPTAETLYTPKGVAVDSTGVYIADTSNNRVLYYSGSSTTATRVYGQGGSYDTRTGNYGGMVSNISLSDPYGVAVSLTGVYIVDTGNNRVLYYAGTSTTATRVYGQYDFFSANTANNGGRSRYTLYSPNGIAVDSSGVYIADSSNNRVLYFAGTSTNPSRVYGQGGSYSTGTLNKGGITADYLYYPNSVAVSSTGVYIVDGGNCRALYY